MSQTRLTGVGVTLLLAVTLVAGGAVAGVSADGVPADGLQQQDSPTATAVDAEPAQDEGEVDLELRPADETVAPGETASYDLTVVGPDNGISAYWINVTVGDLGVAEIDGYELDRDADFDNSFVTDDNSTAVLEVGMGEESYDPTDEVTVATIDVEAVGEAGESTGVDLAFDAGEAVMDNDDVLYEVADSQSASIEIADPAEFLVTELSPVQDPVEEGETVTVDYTVENAGDLEDTQTVEFLVDGSVEDSEEVSLDGGETFADSFVYETESGDAPEITVAVSTDDDENSTAVTVEESVAEVDLELSPVEETVAQGETASYDLTVVGPENGISAYFVNVTVGDLGVAEIDGFELDRVGDFDNSFVTDDNSTAVLEVGLGDEPYDPADEVTVATIDVAGVGESGESTGVNLTFDPEEAVLDNDDVLYEVADSQSASIEIVNPPEFVVSNLEPSDAEVVEGALVNVSAVVENVGGEGTQQVTLDVGSVEESEDVALDGGESETVGFDPVDTAALGPGEYEHTVSSDNDSVAGSLTVLSEASFEVEIVDATTPVEGDDLAVTADIENVGDVEATQTVELDVGELGTDETEVTLSGGESVEETLTVETGEDDAGEYTATVTSEDDADSTAVTVVEGAFFDVSITDVEESVVEGETVTVEYTVENVGDTQDSQDIEFLVDGSVEDTEGNVDLDDGETFSDAFTYETGSGDTPEIDVTVESEDDADTETVGVLEEGEFAVEITGIEESVAAGETVTAEYEIENVGDAEETQDITFDVDGDLEDIEMDVTLAGGETFADAFTYETSEGDAPGIAVSVSSDDDEDGATVTVEEPAEFAVEITGVEESVAEGETVTAEYTVENVGDAEDSQDIQFLVDGSVESTEADVTLDGDETFADAFTYETSEGDAPEIEVEVASDDDAATETVTVEEAAFFAAAITDVEESVVEGEMVTVEYEVTNTGDIEDTQDITFAVDGGMEDEQEDVTLDGGDTFSGQFFYETSEGDAPEIEVEVASADDAATATVDVLTEAFFAAEITDIDEEVVEGETVLLSYEVTNTGDLEETQDITFEVDGDLEDVQEDVTLDGGDTFAGQFFYETSGADVPEIEVAVSSEDDVATATVDVLAEAFFAVEITEVPDEVTEGAEVTVAYEVTNTGDVEETQDITFAVDGDTQETETAVTLAGDETFADEFVHQTVEGDAPEIEVAVSSEDDTATETVTVNEGAIFAVTITDFDETVVAGETATVEYEVENTGDTEDTQTVEFLVDGETEDSEDVTLSGGDTFAGTFGHETGEDDVPEISVEVASENDAADRTVTVEEPAEFAVDITDVEESVGAGETVTVEYAVENTGGVEETQDITFAVDGDLEATEADVTLAGGETFADAFSYETTDDDTPEIEVAVASDDDEDTATVSVLAPEGVELELSPVEETVAQGETASYDLTVIGPENGISAYFVNVTVGDLGVAEIAGIELDREGQFDNSFVTDDNSTAVLEVGLGDESYDPADEVTVATIDVAGVGESGESTGVDLAFDPEEAVLDNDDVLYEVVDSQSASIEIVNPPEFVVSDLEPSDAEVVEGALVNVSAVVENVGGEGTQQVTLDVGSVEESEDVTLDGGESETVGFDPVDTAALGPGEYEHTVSSDNDSVAGSLTVLSEASFEVEIVDATTPVEGDDLAVTADIENVGDVEATQTVELDVGELGTDETDVTLAGGESVEETLTVETGEDDAGEYTATVTSEDDVDSTTVTVVGAVFFDVAITDVEESVVEGETVTVAYVVTNTGDSEDTQDIQFLVDGSVEETETGVTLGSEETFASAFTYETGSDDTPEIDVTVESEDDADTETVDVLAPANFAVEITDIDEEVGAGETVTVAYEIENVGDTQDSQDIEFLVDGSVEDTEGNVDLDDGETFADAFTYETSEGDAPEIEVEVASEDDAATATVAVDAPPFFAVEITDVEESVVEGEMVGVDYEVTNTGSIEDTQDITFEVDGDLEDAQEDVTLAGDETFSGQFFYETGSDDPPEIEVTVASADDAATETVTVIEDAIFAVSITEVDGPVVAGEAVTVAYEVTNTGDSEDTQDITFAVDGDVQDSVEELTLAGGETASDEFTHETAEGDAPEIEVEVASEDDADTETVVVLSPPAFAVEITDVPESVVEGETVTVAYEVTNTGDVEGTQAVEFAVDGEIEGSQEVTLDAGETEGDEFTHETAEGDAPEIEVEVASADDADTETVTVDAPAAFEVSITDIEESVIEGETLGVDYEVSNAGTLTDTQDITLAVDGTVEDTEEDVTLGDGDTFSGQFFYETGSDDPPEIEVEVASADDAATETVTVFEDAIFAVSITDIDEEVVEGEELTVAYEIINTGETEDTQDITFAVDGDTQETEEDVTLAGGDTFDGEFTHETAVGDAPVVNVSVASADDEATGAVTVVEGAFFDVTVTAVEDEVIEGENITVAYEVTNTGVATGTQNVTLGIDDETVAVTPNVTLEGNATTNGTFTYETGSDDPPEVAATVASGNDADTETVTVLALATFEVEITETNAPLLAGEDLLVTVGIENVGDLAGERLLQADAGDLGSDETEVDLEGGQTTATTFVFESESVQTGTYNVTVDIGDDIDSALTELHPEPLPGNDERPRDLSGDGLYEDIDGDGNFTIFDVQSFFNEFNSDVVAEYAPAFNFNEDEDGDIAIFDVQALFNRLSEWPLEGMAARDG